MRQNETFVFDVDFDNKADANGGAPQYVALDNSFLAGPHAFISKGTEIRTPVSFHANVKIGNGVKVGKYTYFADHATAEYVEIGSYCSIGPSAHIGIGGLCAAHPMNWLSTHPFQYNKTLLGYDEAYSNKDRTTYPFQDVSPITHIGSDVWIGFGAQIKRGVMIGHGAVIAAAAVVTNDVPPYMMAAGVPAKIKRPRFSDKVISELLELRWWDMNPDWMNVADFSNVEECIERLKSVKNAFDRIREKEEHDRTTLSINSIFEKAISGGLCHDDFNSTYNTFIESGQNELAQKLRHIWERTPPIEKTMTE